MKNSRALQIAEIALRSMGRKRFTPAKAARLIRYLQMHGLTPAQCDARDVCAAMAVQRAQLEAHGRAIDEIREQIENSKKETQE